MGNTGDSSQPNVGVMDFEMCENNISLMTLDGHKSPKILYLGENEQTQITNDSLQIINESCSKKAISEVNICIKAS